jgi:hypothetical protein
MGHEGRIRRMTNVLVTKSEGNESLRKYRCRQGDNIETNLNEIACAGVSGVIRFS